MIDGKRLLFLSLALLVLLSGCTPKGEVQGNLFVEIGDVEGVFSLAVSRESETCAAQNADNSVLEAGACFGFSLPEREADFTLSVYGGTGQFMGTPLLEKRFSHDFSLGSAYILLGTDENGALRAVFH